MSATKTKARVSPELPDSYEAAVHELEALIAGMEAGQVPLNELLEGHRRGSVLLKFCHERLREVEQQVNTLVGPDGGRSVGGIE